MISNWCTLGRALPVRGTQAVGPGVAAADDDDLLALGGDRRLPVLAQDVVALLHPVTPRQVLHRLVDAVQLPAGHGQVAPIGRAAGQHHRIEIGQQLLGGDVDADVDAGPEYGSLGAHLVQPPVEDALFHLEFRNAVTQQPTDAIGAFEDGDAVAGAGQLLGGGQTCRPRTYHGDGLSGQLVRRQRLHEAFVEGLVDDLQLDLLDRHRILVDAQHACRLARRRTQPAGEVGEVVGGVQPFDRVAPTAPAHQVVPFRNQVAQRTPVVAEGDTAVHAASRLMAQGLVGEFLVDLVPVTKPQRDRPALRQFPMRVFQEAARISHARPP